MSFSDTIQKVKTSITTLSPKMMVALVAGLIFAIAALFYYRYYVAPSMSTTYKANREVLSNDSPNGKTAELLFFYTDWCPHCKTAKPVWEDIKAEYQTKRINGYKVIFTDVNCTNDSVDIEQMMDKYKVEGYPTIKLLKDGQVIEYDAKPSRDTLVQFLNTVL